MEKMNRSTIERFRLELKLAQAVVIGAGAGLSAAAGYSYTGERFHKYFEDFINKYGFRDMYSGGFYPFETLEEYWAYWSRYIYINRYLDIDNGTYKNLRKLAAGKDYQIITTNVDHCFQRSGFEKERLFYTQGDYGLFQCSVPCHQNTYDNETAVKKMYAEQRNMKIPSELIPCCPVCHKPMTMNLRADHRFVEDEGWHRAAGRYQDFLDRHREKKVLFLELGVGYNTPGIIKYPFWKMTHEWPNAFYVCVNSGEAYAPKEIGEKMVCIEANIGDVLRDF